MVCSVTANFSMGRDPDRAALTPGDFFASVKEYESSEGMSDDEILATCQLMALGPKRGKRGAS